MNTHLFAPLERLTMEILYAKNLYFQTKVRGNNLDEIKAYCTEHKLEITEILVTPYRKTKYAVWANKPNGRIRVLRKEIREEVGWKIIETEPTAKMHWITYERISE